MASFDFEGRAVAYEPGDSIASALYRAGVRTFSRSFKYHRPRGLYCLTGDCPNCLVTVDGEPGTRSCVTPAAAGLRVSRGTGWPSPDRDALSLLWHARKLLPVGFYYKALAKPAWAWPRAERVVRRVAGIGPVSLALPPAEREATTHLPDVLVVGAGPAGRAAAKQAADAGETVLLVDEGEIDHAPPNVTVLERAEAIGIYEGPLVPVSAPDRLHRVRPRRIVVATGAVERHAVFPGNDLPGVWLGRGAARLATRHGLAVGRRAVAVGSGPEIDGHVQALRAVGVDVRAVGDAEVVRAEGRGRVERVVVGGETIECDALVLSLGLVPRDALLRMAGPGEPVVGAGDVLAADPLLRCGRSGFVCFCEDVEAKDLADAFAEGFRSTELLKRYTTATMGPCQGALCHAPLRAFVQERAPGSEAVSAPTTARPPARPIRLEDAAAGVRFDLHQHTALHERHLELGAVMEPAGTWKRPESYGDLLAEYWAVRRGVSVMDVGTLGKFLVAGRDATEFLERLYPCHVHDLAPGRIRYALVLNEAGHVIDDGMICALEGGRYYVTFTSGGAEQAEGWLRDWAETWGLSVHVVNETAARGAINLCGPGARELLGALCSGPVDNESFPYLRTRALDVASVPCLAIRLGFVGELSYELHHPSSRSVELWNALLGAGASAGIRPHGLEALRLLRLEKGHVIVGQDTDFDSTPAKLGLDFAVRLDKDTFVGKRSLQRIAALPLRQRLAPLVFDGAAPGEGASLFAGGEQVGHLTSSRFSPALGHGVALGWLRRRNGGFPTEVRASDGETGRVVSGAFYDPEGVKLRA